MESITEVWFLIALIAISVSCLVVHLFFGWIEKKVDRDIARIYADRSSQGTFTRSYGLRIPRWPENASIGFMDEPGEPRMMVAYNGKWYDTTNKRSAQQGMSLTIRVTSDDGHARGNSFRRIHEYMSQEEPHGTWITWIPGRTEAIRVIRLFGKYLWCIETEDGEEILRDNVEYDDPGPAFRAAAMMVYELTGVSLVFKFDFDRTDFYDPILRDTYRKINVSDALGIVWSEGL